MSTLSFALTGFVQRLNDTLSIRPGGMIPPMSDVLSGMLVLCFAQVVWLTIKLNDLKHKVARLEKAIQKEHPSESATHS